MKNSDEEDLVKFTIAGYVLGFFIISLFLFDNSPLVNSHNLFPFYTSAPLLICIFLLGYTFNKSLVKVISKEEKEAVEEDNDNETITL